MAYGEDLLPRLLEQAQSADRSVCVELLDGGRVLTNVKWLRGVSHPNNIYSGEDEEGYRHRFVWRNVQSFWTRAKHEQRKKVDTQPGMAEYLRDEFGTTE